MTKSEFLRNMFWLREHVSCFWSTTIGLVASLVVGLRNEGIAVRRSNCIRYNYLILDQVLDCLREGVGGKMNGTYHEKKCARAWSIRNDSGVDWRHFRNEPNSLAHFGSNIITTQSPDHICAGLSNYFNKKSFKKSALFIAIFHSHENPT